MKPKKEIEIFSSCGMKVKISKKESREIDQILKSKDFNNFLDRFIKENNVKVITEK